MQHLGHTRSARQSSHLLQTPDTFVRAPLPGMTNATAIVHINPAGGARFTQYTAEFGAGGSLGPTADQRFVYVLDGELEVDNTVLTPGGFAYMPASAATVRARTASARATVIEKPWVPARGVTMPRAFTSHEHRVASTPLNGDEALQVRSLVPADAAFDFAVNTMTYEPGAALSLVEIHVMEHGVLMLEGGGIYRLDDCWYPTTAGDFIWMAPFCPQWFGAIGKVPAKYLIYKDWNR